MKYLPVVLLVLLLGGTCEPFDDTPDQPHTRVLVHNRTDEPYTLGADTIPPTFSGEVFLLHGETRRLEFGRVGTTVGELVFTSLVDPGETEVYDAGASMFEDDPGVYTFPEYSPWFDLVLETP